MLSILSFQSVHKILSNQLVELTNSLHFRSQWVQTGRPCHHRAGRRAVEREGRGVEVSADAECGRAVGRCKLGAYCALSNCRPSETDDLHFFFNFFFYKILYPIFLYFICGVCLWLYLFSKIIIRQRFFNTLVNVNSMKYIFFFLSNFDFVVQFPIKKICKIIEE